MPYIAQESRKRLAAHLLIPHCETIGEANFVITQVCINVLGPNPSYAQINAMIGALECAKLELYRRVAVPYEERKCAQHGDVYPDVEEARR